MLRHPPFDALVAFEAVGRLGSVTKAAAEIGLTQSAVSHRVRRLEAFMGSGLFDRRADGVALNPVGRRLHSEVLELLSRAEALKDHCIDTEAPARLRIGVSAALADNWLLRRLPHFTAAHPGITVEVIIKERNEADAGVDARVMWVPASEARATSTQMPLFREHVFPVCSPGLLDGRPPSANLLTELPLLHKKAPGQGPEWEWSTWFSRLDLSGSPTETLHFTSIAPTISAALSGAGAALVRSMLVYDALAEGRVVRLVPEEFDQLSGKVHVLRWPARHINSKHVRAFAAWLSRAARDCAPEPFSAAVGDLATGARE